MTSDPRYTVVLTSETHTNLIPQEYYRMQGGDVSDGAAWHRYMLDKCFVSYTDYHGCKLDQQEANLEKMRVAFGEEKWKESQDTVKALLKGKFGDERGEQVWEYNKASNKRFKELRKAVDDERGIIRDIKPSPLIDPVGEGETTPPKEEPPPKDAPTPGFKGWWSEPESRLKKKSAS